jgi:hypothetical protein
MTAQRLVVALAAWLVTAGLAVTAVRGADAPDLRCGQEPGTRFFWTEWGFCDLEPHGPEKARGLVIWNHGISGTEVQYKAPPALAMRLLHARGWDIIKLNRNNLGETSRDLSLARPQERNEAEIRAQLARGYRKVVARRPVLRRLYRAGNRRRGRAMSSAWSPWRPGSPRAGAWTGSIRASPSG